jgi:NAD(P)-dependent dehydrogenase (short-subunit alcohol dehydrogenase family)
MLSLLEWLLRAAAVINIASNAAFQPLAGASVYAASKAFVLFFSEARAFELEKTNVRVLAACPGPVATRFFADMNPKMRAKQMDEPAADRAGFCWRQESRHSREAFGTAWYVDRAADAKKYDSSTCSGNGEATEAKGSLES